MKLPVKNCYQAFAIHFLASLLFILLVDWVILLLWYPAPYLLGAEGGWKILGIMMISVLVIGPLLTLIVFKPGKAGLKIDLIIILCLQVAAMFYGSAVIYKERPIFAVFAVDRFTLVSQGDVDLSELDDALVNKMGDRGPLPVIARMPEDETEQSKLIESIFAGEPDLEFRTKFYEPLLPQITDILTRSRRIEDFTREEETGRKVRQFVAEHQLSLGDHAFFPLVGKSKDMLAVLNKSTGQIVGAIDVDPWK